MKRQGNVEACACHLEGETNEVTALQFQKALSLAAFGGAVLECEVPGGTMSHHPHLTIEPSESAILPLGQRPAVGLPIHCLWPQSGCHEKDRSLALHNHAGKPVSDGKHQFWQEIVQLRETSITEGWLP